ncbi:hypothetical protein QFZ41_002662 [Luteibacter sp. W1I16]|uniref:hypothetical protein n=1 Tax=Luteibacter sp. W1I16 TaxID=3373922 RepID=UPI003D1A3B55
MTDGSDFNGLLLQRLTVPLRDGILTVTREIDPFLVAIENAFPFPRHRLDWSQVPGVISAGGLGISGAPQLFVTFMQRLIADRHLTGQVVVVGDYVELAVTGDVKDVTAHLAEIAEAPQHIYVFPFPHVAWCASLAFEGWIDFALAPPPGHNIMITGQAT